MEKFVKSELSPRYDPKNVEGRVYQAWEKSGFFNPDKLPGKRKRPFTIMMAPPNVTGSLHMGHALEYATSDVLVRMRRMQGYRTLWLPGTDHAGIATQNVVEKELQKQGLSRFELGRKKFIQKVWEWKEEYGNTIITQLKTLGCSADWSRLRFTMDPAYQGAVREAFLHYYKKGWIYRAERVISWCTRCKTSLSDLEVEHKEMPATLYFINYPLADGSGVITVATTRPETMLGDTAVAVNPKDARYTKYIGKVAILPIQNRKIPVIADKAIDENFGTGAVKVTPAHDITDAEIGERHQLPSFKIIGEDGVMTSAAGPLCAGKKVGECRAAVIEELRQKNHIEREESYTHNNAVCYRCGSIIEPLPSMQWFLKMDRLAKMAIAAVKSGKVRFHPKRWEKVYFDWLKNIRDWTISRQIWWGHRLPVWFHEPKCVPRGGHEGDIVKCTEYAISAGKPACEYCNTEFIQSEDVLDTWFSSALWPFATLGWPKKTRDLKRFYPADVNTNDRGIINLWDARMIFSGLECMRKSPFRDLIIHATILTRDGERMSKSKGTGIDPMELVARYGADATRFGIMWQALGGQDIRWSEEHVVAGKKFCNKIWNATRFVIMQFPEVISQHLPRPRSATREDRKILRGLERVKKDVTRFIDRYEFGKALHTFHDFFWHEFCDRYIEQAKVKLGDEQLQKNTKHILLWVIISSLKILHPFMPFITEELWKALPSKNKKPLLTESW